MTLLAILFLILAVGCRAISELANHGKLKWSKEGNGFWDSSSWKRKYKIKWLKSKDGSLPDFGQFIPAPTTYYYKLFNLKYKEACSSVCISRISCPIAVNVQRGKLLVLLAGDTCGSCFVL